MLEELLFPGVGWMCPGIEEAEPHVLQLCLLRLRQAVPDFSSSAGILIPLCESGTCTLREAIIIGSILTKCSIPVLHSR